MTFTKKILPDFIEVSGVCYKINTDFQYFILFLQKLKNKVSDLKEYDFMYASRTPRNRLLGFNQLKSFTYPEKPLPRNPRAVSDEILLDYELDAELIYSAFYKEYKIDLFDENLHLHWYKFQALLSGLQETKLNQIMKIRSYKPSQNDSPQYRKEMREQYEIWHIEPELSQEEKLEIERFDALLNQK